MLPWTSSLGRTWSGTRLRRNRADWWSSGRSLEAFESSCNTRNSSRSVGSASSIFLTWTKSPTSLKRDACFSSRICPPPSTRGLHKSTPFLVPCFHSHEPVRVAYHAPGQQCSNFICPTRALIECIYDL